MFVKRMKKMVWANAKNKTNTINEIAISRNNIPNS